MNNLAENWANVFFVEEKFHQKKPRNENYTPQPNEDWEKIDTFKGHLVEKREDFSPCFS